ncbi:aminoglycoside phosphotransferase family protein [Streptomyces meridianus]|uniref:Aminoglycoside phosphotransferase family protein n=1 Tax=Streptomyces meridianus TaxID=2938945 RepID=A0ABT0X9E7_9ACTN|nr:aminoglycoside phosphotransferase family protein [Streptomyces meridianus]MCM2578910.1 aminoglycoside phosphotransferase family protein [Streptomyces meridianus]
MGSAAQPEGAAGLRAPRRLVQALAAAPGSADALWLEQLPSLAGGLLDRWELTAERVQAPGGRSSLVVLVRRADGEAAALKLLPPSARGLREEAALAHWNGWGAVRLLDVDPDAGALLLERLHGEVSLSALPDAKALLEAAGTVRRLWVEPPEDHPFETVAECTARAAGRMRAAADRPEAADLGPLVDEALAARDRLTADPSEMFLLHGRFRQGKVLSADRMPWLAVGPEPLVGERAYDLARLVRDRMEDLVAASAGASSARRRIVRLADSLEVDGERLRAWALFRAVDSGTRLIAEGRAREGALLLEYAGWL